MSDQNPNKTIMGIPGINFNAPNEEDEAVEKPDPGRQTMFGLPSGSLPQAMVSEVEDDDDGMPTQIVSADSFSFDSEPAEEVDSSGLDLRSTAMGGLPSLGKRRAPNVPVEDNDQPRGPMGGFARAFDGDEDDGEDGGALFAKFTESKPVKHATLMGMSLEDVLAQEQAAEKAAGKEAPSEDASRSTMFSMPAPSLEEMKAALDDVPDEDASRSTMFSMPAPSFEAPVGAELSEVSEGDDDDLPTAAIGVEQLQEFAEKEVDGLDNRKRLLAKLRSTRKQEDAKESETKGTMFGIPGINHERDASGSRAPITGVLKMPKKRDRTADEGVSPLGGSSYTLPRPGDVKAQGDDTPSFSLPARPTEPVGESPSDPGESSSSVASEEFGKQLEASFNGKPTPSPDFGAISMNEAIPDRFGSQPVIQLGALADDLDVSPMDMSSIGEEFSEAEDAPGIDPFAETQVANINDLAPFSFDTGGADDAPGEYAFDEGDAELDTGVDPSSVPAADASAPEFGETSAPFEEPEEQFKPRDPLPTPMFTGMEMEMFPGREGRAEQAPQAVEPEPPAPHVEPARPAPAASHSELPVASRSNSTGSMIQQIPSQVGVGSKGQRVLGAFSSLPLIGATPLAFVLGGASGGVIVLAVAPAVMGALAMVLAALGIDPKLRSAGLAVVGLISVVVAAGALLIGLHVVVALCAGAGAFFALFGAAFPFLVGGSSS